MAGDESGAREHLGAEGASASRIAGEVAVLLDQEEYLSSSTPASTRARALWARGDLSQAVRILEDHGRAQTSQARRLRSELALLEEGRRLRVSTSEGGAIRKGDPPGDRLRVLHLITNSLPHTQSGYALRTHNILTTLASTGVESLALTRTGYPVMVGKALCEDEDLVDGIRYRRTLPRSLGDTPEERLDQEVSEALRLVDEFRPHVLHATTDYRNALVAQAVSRATGIPWVFEVRGLMEQTWIASHRSETSRRIAADSERTRRIIAAESSLAREADEVVTLSRTMADVLVSRGVDPERITLVPNGVDPVLFEERLTPAEARAKIGAPLDADDLVVGAVGAIVDYEGLDVLLRAVAALISDAGAPPGVKARLRVLLVGDGVAAPALSELARELGIEDRLVMPGAVAPKSARAWVQALDVVVVPRRDREVSRTVTPQKPAEAMALGRPVVVSDLPALRETVTAEDGRLLGVLVPPDDADALASTLGSLLEDSEARNRAAEVARASVIDRSWTTLMRRYELLYRAAVAHATEGPGHGE
ncbi:glycosyltransferase family 4 protein [Brachybacterium sp. NBEC-018]|uniref:glycosyltransferase family 4 protein n=1 Tax=Brachybacterium sp. NBEC-018 TaxID=2996004 RepID=UPI002174D8BD|nr:glycosyltransferase family 4 protein [Brachybacterium sp. NBEC-018]UVY85067.1 glycosyltransferase family 4 protein [Brachybacterium sp. NBEC-018]